MARCTEARFGSVTVEKETAQCDWKSKETMSELTFSREDVVRKVLLHVESWCGPILQYEAENIDSSLSYTHWTIPQAETETLCSGLSISQPARYSIFPAITLLCDISSIIQICLILLVDALATFK